MARKKLPWFRFYIADLNDDAAQNLPPQLFKHWVNILCVARMTDGILPPAKALAFHLRIPITQVAGVLIALEKAELLEQDSEGNCAPTDWAERQYESDTSAARMKRLREKNCGLVTSQRRHNDRHGDGVSDGSPLYRNREQIQKQNIDTKETQKNAAAAVVDSDAALSGTVLPEQWEPSAAAAAHVSKTFPTVDIAFQTERFRNRALSITGERALSRNWDANWIDWMARARTEYDSEGKFVGRGKGRVPQAANGMDERERRRRYPTQAEADEDVQNSMVELSEIIHKEGIGHGSRVNQTGR